MKRYQAKLLQLSSICTVCLLAVAACEKEDSQDETPVSMTIERAVALAGEQAAKLGYEIKEMDTQCDEVNTAWNKHVQQYADFYDSLPELKAKLADRDYWAVYFGPRLDVEEPRLGGDIWVFVGKDTGEILSYLRGK